MSPRGGSWSALDAVCLEARSSDSSWKSMKLNPFRGTKRSVLSVQSLVCGCGGVRSSLLRTTSLFAIILGLSWMQAHGFPELEVLEAVSLVGVLKVRALDVWS